MSTSNPLVTVATGSLRHVPLDDILPGENNPRHLFDEEPLQALKESIRTHGVLVPILIHSIKGSNRYQILDGERRYRCCQDLVKEGVDRSTIPANVVETLSKLSALLYMFSVHNIREGWELMPTALGLKAVMDQLDETQADNKRLRELTGLSEPQIERCRSLLTFPEEFQLMSLDTNPTTRIPSNFWTEAKPFLDFMGKNLPEDEATYGGRDGLTRRLVQKYRHKSIKSVIHFRRVIEAVDKAWGSDQGTDAEDLRMTTRTRIIEWLNDLDYDTKVAFDPLIVEERRVRQAMDACADFKKKLDRLRLNYEIDRDELRAALEDVQRYLTDLLEALRGEDPPPPDLDQLDFDGLESQ